MDLACNVPFEKYITTTLSTAAPRTTPSPYSSSVTTAHVATRRKGKIQRTTPPKINPEPTAKVKAEILTVRSYNQASQVTDITTTAISDTSASSRDSLSEDSLIIFGGDSVDLNRDFSFDDGTLISENEADASLANLIDGSEIEEAVTKVDVLTDPPAVVTYPRTSPASPGGKMNTTQWPRLRPARPSKPPRRRRPQRPPNKQAVGHRPITTQRAGQGEGMLLRDYAHGLLRFAL